MSEKKEQVWEIDEATLKEMVEKDFGVRNAQEAELLVEAIRLMTYSYNKHESEKQRDK